MSSFKTFLFAFFASTVVFTVSVRALASKTIPAPPTYYVLDEPQALSPKAREALQALLIEHDHLTGEQFVIAIFQSLEGEDPVEFTSKVFSTWAIGQRGKDNGVLLALYVEDRKARIEVGYGLEPLLTDAKTKDIIENFLIPEMKQNQPDRALSLATLEILKTLNSPLIENGKAEQILRGGGVQGSFVPTRDIHSQNPLGLFIGLGLIIFIIVMNQITSAEAHFTGQGWYKPRPWERGFRTGGRGGFGGGGFFGGGWGGGGWGGGSSGGGGGFIGGGGSSGGGGAEWKLVKEKSYETLTHRESDSSRREKYDR